MTEKKKPTPSPAGTPTSTMIRVEPTKTAEGTPTSKLVEVAAEPSPTGTPTSYFDVEPKPPPWKPRPKRVKPPKKISISKPSRARKRVKRRRTGISSSMISWNEATTIDLALKSIVDLVDEVVLVDTGSFDGTCVIAREWMDALDLSGQVKQIKITNLAQAHLAAFELCSTDWVIIQDSNLVFSEALNAEFTSHIKNKPETQLAVKSLNLMGDYEHYFKALPYHTPHKILVRRDKDYTQNTERQYFNMPATAAKHWAVNLSRVRPAWRSWYRGEPFDRKRYAPKGSTPEAKGHMHELNRQYQWHKRTQYTSLVEFVQATMGLSLEDVKNIAPDWYLKYLQAEAAPLKRFMKKALPGAIREELKSPRYKLILKNGKIVGRWPEL